MNDSADELERSKQSFLKSVSKAFLGPIKESVSAVEKMRSGGESCKDSASAELLQRILQRLQTGAENMMYLTEIQNHSFRTKAEPVESIRDFEAFTLRFLSLSQEEGLNFYIYIDPNFPREVLFDRTHIFHVLANLLFNAFGYTAKGGNVYIDIRSKNVENKLVELTFSVTDTGTGIPKEKVRKLLKPFASSDSEGMGLGISGSYHILKALGSQLKIASEENKGSRFSFSIKAQTKFEPSFEILPSLSIGVFLDSRGLLGDAKILYQYFISMGVDVVTINDVKDEKIGRCDALFMLTTRHEKNKEEYFKKQFPKTCLIPVIQESYAAEFENEFGAQAQKLLLPAVPTKIYEQLHHVKTQRANRVAAQQSKGKKTPPERLKKEERLEPLRILVAEDNAINLKLVQVVLGRYDFIIDSAKNGEIAVEMCKKTHYDLVLMDIDMPVMDGITANRLIKEYEKSEGIPGTPIVALTSHDLIGERAEILASGLDEHMVKPLNIARLEMMLERYLGYKSKK